MKMKKVAFLLLLSLFLGVSSQAQVKIFTTAQDTIPVNQNAYSTDIKVANYNKIVGTQFTLNWDSSVLEFVDVGNLWNEDLSFDLNIGLGGTSSGIFTYLWVDNSLEGIDLADSTTLFTLNFNVVGGASDSSPIAFIDEPTLKEVSDTSFLAISTDFIDGLVRIAADGTVSNTRNNPEELNIVSISPNPIQNNTAQLVFFLKKSDTLRMRLVSMNGQELQTQTQDFQAGKHNINIDVADDLPSGTYLLHLESDSFYAVDKIIIQQ